MNLNSKRPGLRSAIFMEFSKGLDSRVSLLDRINGKTELPTFIYKIFHLSGIGLIVHLQKKVYFIGISKKPEHNPQWGKYFST